MNKHTLLLALFSTCSAAFDASANDNVVVYWGQNSANQADSQKSLSYYCQQPDVDMVVLAFLNNFFDTADGLPGDNFAGSCATPYEGTNLQSCASMNEDIQTCQSLGVKVLLSLGGAAEYSSVGFSSAANATAFADELWGIFGDGTDKSSIRPFGDAIIDGFDLDIEAGSSNYYSDFVSEMRNNFKQDTSKPYYISAAPQCPTDPVLYVDDAIYNSDIDFLFVQFYNNDCGVQNAGTSAFNFAAWDNIAKTTSQNKNVKIYLGVPGSSTAATGYEPTSTVAALAKQLQSKYSSFGGVSIWDASQAWANNDFAAPIKQALESSTTTTTSSFSTSSTSSGVSSTSTKALNSTASVTTEAGKTTTHTVESTSIETITSCAETVTDCPLRNHNGTAYVTHVNTITVVECPESTYTLGSSSSAASAVSIPAEKTTVATSSAPAAPVSPVQFNAEGAVGTSASAESSTIVSKSPAATSSPAAPVEQPSTTSSSQSANSSVPVAPVEETAVPSVAESNAASAISVAGAAALFAGAMLL